MNNIEKMPKLNKQSEKESSPDEIKSKEGKEKKEGQDKWENTLEAVCNLSEKFKEEAADIVKEFWDEWKEKGVSFEESVDLIISSGEMLYNFISEKSRSRWNKESYESALEGWDSNKNKKWTPNRWQHYKTTKIIFQAIEKYFARPESIKDIDNEQTKTFLKLMKISPAVDQVTGMGEFDEERGKERFPWEKQKSTGFYDYGTGAAGVRWFWNALVFKCPEGSEKEVPMLHISYEDRQDYDPEFIREAKNKDRLYKEVLGFDTLTLREDGDIQHYVILDKVIENLKNYLGKNEIKQIEENIEKHRAKQEKEEIQKKKRRKEEWEQKIEEQLSNKEFTLNKEEVELVKKVLEANPFKIGDKNIQREGDLLIIANKGSKSIVSTTTVTDYETLQVAVIDLKNAQLFKSPKRKVLWRSTEQGITGDGFNENIKEVKVEQKDKTVSIKFKDGKSEKIDLTRDGKKIESIEKMSPEVKEAIDKKIKQLQRDLQQSCEHFRIPLHLGSEITRPATVMIGNVDYIDNQTAEVIVTKEIDYKVGKSGREAGPTGYFIQSRIIKYRITPEQVTCIEVKTTDYE